VVVASLNDIFEGVLKGSASDKETVNVWLGNQLCGVFVANTSSVENSCLVGGLSRDVGLEPGSNSNVCLLSLLWSGNLTSADGPDGFVSDDDVGPVVDEFTDCGKLLCVDVIGLARFSLVEFLTNAGHNLEIVVDSVLHLLSDDLVSLAKDVATFTVAENGPSETHVSDHLWGSFSSVCTGSEEG